MLDLVHGEGGMEMRMLASGQQPPDALQCVVFAHKRRQQQLQALIGSTKQSETSVLPIGETIPVTL